MGNAEYMGSSGDDITSHRTSWLSLDSRRRKSTPSNSPLTSMTSREMARLMPSMQATSPCLQPEPNSQDHRRDRRPIREGQEDALQGLFPMYKACKDSKDQGGFHDFVEILKLYDKNEDNTM